MPIRIPPPALTRARLHGQLAVLDAEALRLSLSEAQGLAKVHSEQRLSAAQVRAMHRQVQGWAAGLTLLLRRAQPVQISPAPATNALLFDYFAAEVFTKADLTTQTFLLKTALFPTMTVAMADQLTGGDGRKHC